MKYLAVTALLLMTLNALACSGSKGKEEDEEEKDQRSSVLR